VQALKHIEKHPIASQHTNEIAHILNNPDLITPNPGELETHVFYKVFEGKWLFALPVQIKMEIRIISSVVEFIFGPSKRIMFGDEDWLGLDVGRDSRSKKIVAYMSLSFPQLYRQILTELKLKPIAGRFSVEFLVDTGKATPICDPRVKNVTFAEIVQWVWEKYYAHLEATPVKEPMTAETMQA